MKKSLRIQHHVIASEKELTASIELVKKYVDVVDEITIFTEPTHHGYVPIAQAKKNADLLKNAINLYKSLGIKRVGVNVLCTIGHTDDGGDMHERANLRYMVNEHGVSSKSCLCPSGDGFLEYISARYALYAGTGADFIWLDDDVRPGNHGIVQECCFCPDCIAKFNQRNGTKYSFDEIVDFFFKDKKFRKEYLSSNEKTIIDMVEVATASAKKVNPKIEMGVMWGGRVNITDRANACGATLARPGGGFYNDRSLFQLLEKHFVIQVCLLGKPDYIKDIQYEYEAFNYLTFEKSLLTSELETSLALSCGCNGILYNRWRHTPDFLDMMRASNKKWEVFSSRSENTKTVGVYCFDPFAATRIEELGVPVTADLDNAVAHFILGEHWNEFTDDQIEKMLKIGAYTDVLGAKVLAERGFDLGANVVKTYKNGVYERFSDNPLNAEFAGGERFVSMDIFYEGDAYALSVPKDAQPLSYLTTLYKRLECCSFIKKDEKTAVMVDGCFMINQLQTASKRTQLVNVFEELSNHTLPVYIQKACKIAPIFTRNDKNATLTLVNAHLDPVENFTIKVRSACDFMLVNDKGELVPIEQKTCGKETEIKIDKISGWGYLLLVGKPM